MQLRSRVLVSDVHADLSGHTLIVFIVVLLQKFLLLSEVSQGLQWLRRLGALVLTDGLFSFFEIVGILVEKGPLTG